MTASPAGAAVRTVACLSILVALTACGANQSVHDSAEGPAWEAGAAYESVDEEPALGLPPDIAATAPALALQLQATPEPVAPRTGGGSASDLPMPAPAEGQGSGNRRIIKNATMSLEVEDVDLALSRIDGIAAQSGGYVIETRTDYTDPFRKRAFQQIAVPVDRFESALQRIREAAGKVLSEEASGVDVSQEFVDVQSQIANLEATQARVRQFLADATTVEEALQVNAELTRIEGELGQLKGRLQYLEQRSAFSTIAVSLAEPEPDPTVTPTPTITPTPTATPTATPRPPWEPGRTAGRALGSLRDALQSIGDLAIWLVLGVLPVLVVVALPFVVIAYTVRNARRGRKGGG